MENGKFTRLKELYDANLFLDAYSLIKDDCEQPGWLDAACADEIVAAGRLANRLGSDKLRRWLMRTALERFPDNPTVMVESRWISRRYWPVLRVLEESLARPELNSGDPQLDAHWLVDGALYWSIVRDFHKSHQMLDRASGIITPDTWFYSTRSYILFSEDRWEEALEDARMAWDFSPNKPAAAAQLAHTLLRFNLFDEAFEKLSIAKNGQSFEALLMLAWVYCARAERSDRTTRLQLAQQAAEFCQRIEELTPLRDRFAERQIAACRFDIAMLAEQTEGIAELMTCLPIPVYQQIGRNLQENPNGKRIFLSCPAVFQKRDGCLPSSIAAIAGFFGRSLDSDDLAKALTYDGTPTWRALAWLRENDYEARVFILTEETTRLLLSQGIPFVFTFVTSIEDAHATAAIGVDDAAGTLVYHDPAVERFGHMLLERLGESGAPLGPWGLAFVPKDRAALLNCIPENDAQMGELCQKFWHAITKQETTGVSEVLSQMETKWPDSPITAALKAHFQTLTNQIAEGIATLEGLCAEYPKNLELQRMLLLGLSRTRNTARIREFLSEVVQREKIPGISDAMPWDYPPPPCIAQYADIEGMTAEGADKAIKTLLRLLERNPAYGGAYHSLADIYLRQGQIEKASLLHRLSSLLEHTNEHFAHATFYTLLLLRRQDEGIAYLRNRVERLGGLTDGGKPWMTLITAHEDCGNIEMARAIAEEALSKRPQDSELLVLLTRFQIKIGNWDKAQELLERLKQIGNKQHYLEAAVYYNHLQGRWQEALECCKAWALESIDNIEPYRMLATLMRNNESVFAVEQAAKKWAEERIDDEAFEFIYYDQIVASFQNEKRKDFVQARIKRNAQDYWAWCELGHLLIDEADAVEPVQREHLLEEIHRTIKRTIQLAPNNASTLYLQSRLAEMQGNWEQSVEFLLNGLRLEPETDMAYLRAWENSANLSREAQEQILCRLEKRLLMTPARLHQARALALQIAARMGADYAKQCVQRWQERRPNDPDLIEAYADVVLEYGQGRTAAAEIINTLEDAVHSFPQHLDLQVSLARAYDILLETERKQEILRTALRARPLNTGIRSALATDMLDQDRPEEAVVLLREGIELNPQEAGNWLQLAWAQHQMGNTTDASQTLAQSLILLPENIEIRQNLVARLCELGRAPEALELLRQALQIYPRSPVYWHLLGDVLTNPVVCNAPEAETALRTALDCHYTYYEAADSLARLLANQYRFDEAQSVIEKILPHMHNAAQAHGRLAWITWSGGQRHNAVDQMAEVLKTYPDFRGGWWMLMDWLEEMNESEITCRFLEDVPTTMRADTEIIARRLGLLAKAGLSDDKLEAAWQQARNDFPRNEDLLVLYFALLIERGQWERAHEILSQADDFRRHSPQVLLCKLQLAAHNQNVPQAVEAAMEILRQERTTMPHYRMWPFLAEPAILTPIVQAVVDELAAGRTLNVDALAQMIEHSAGVSDIRVNGKEIVNSVGMLQWLAAHMMSCGWDRNYAVLAAILEELATRDRNYVKKFLAANYALCRSHTCLWQAIGYYHINNSAPPKAREWLFDWRERKGAQMSAVSYLRHSFGDQPLVSEYPAIYETSRDVLGRLAEDGAVLMHVTALCEALLGMGRLPEFIEAVSRYRNLLESDDELLWTTNFYKQQRTAKRLCLLADLLQTDDRSTAVSIFARLCTKPRQRLIYSFAFKYMKRWLGYWKRRAVAKGRTIGK